MIISPIFGSECRGRGPRRFRVTDCATPPTFQWGDNVPEGAVLPNVTISASGDYVINFPDTATVGEYDLIVSCCES